MDAPTDFPVLARIVDNLDLPPVLASFFSELDLADEDLDRMGDLMQKMDSLSEDERQELANYVFLNEFFALLQRRAMQVLDDETSHDSPLVS